MAGSLDAPIAKLRRAIHHYRTLKALHRGGDHQHRTVSCQAHVDGLTYEFRIGEVEPLDPQIPLVLGDAYHNLRAALDCLVFQLHERRFRGNVPRRSAKNSAFPIFAEQPRYGRKDCDVSLRGCVIPTDEWPSIKALGHRERTAIEWLQPYKGWDPKWPRPKSNVGKLRLGLADINRFDIIDKHHQPHLVAAVLVSVGEPRFPVDDFGFLHQPQFPPRNAPLVSLVAGAHVDTWTFRRPPPPEYMHMHPGVRTGVGMEPIRGQRIDVLPNLGGSIWVVTQVILQFAPRFAPTDLSDLRGDLGDVHQGA